MLIDILDDHFHDACGVFGVCNHAESANLVYLGLYALQHRGQESAGIVSVEDRIFHCHRGRGLVADLIKRHDIERLHGRQAIGHVRYSTAGGSANARNRQPLVVDTAHGGLAVAHNGNLVNAVEMRRRLERQGAIFQSTMDTEVIVHLTARSRKDTLPERLVEALQQVDGAYALLAMSENSLIGVRDPAGIRPLVLGRWPDRTPRRAGCVPSLLSWSKPLCASAIGLAPRARTAQLRATARQSLHRQPLCCRVLDDPFALVFSQLCTHSRDVQVLWCRRWPGSCSVLVDPFALLFGVLCTHSRAVQVLWCRRWPGWLLLPLVAFFLSCCLTRTRTMRCRDRTYLCYSVCRSVGSNCSGSARTCS